MCGIAGGYNLHEIKHAQHALSHRGPDSFGVWSEDEADLVHTRLAILDLSSLGHQPMEFDDLVITFNGEVYNYQSIKETLEKNGYPFKSETDTEVVLKAFHFWGYDCVKQFNGMFAFAIYNKKDKSFFVARDHIGIKPLYYYYKDATFGFASELKAFPKKCRNKINEKAVIEFLSLSYIPSPYSIYQDIYKLEPGHFIIYKDNHIQKKCYWNIADKKTYQNHFEFKNYNQVLEVVDSTLRNSIKQQLQADVNIGSFLSGGIDSSLVTAIANDVSSDTVHSYSMGFNEKEYDESPFAIAISKHIGTQHTNLTFTHKDVLDLLNDYDYYFDEPFGDSASLPLSILCKKAKEQNLTVALTGDGGDELFLGYTRYLFATKYYKRFNKFPSFINQSFASLLGITGKDKALKMMYPINNPSLLNFYQVISTAIKPWDLNQIISKDLTQKHFKNHPPSLFDVLNLAPFDVDNEKDLSLIDFKRNLPDDMLTKSDRASMRFSMELRVPILDKDLAEISRQIPLGFLLKNGEKKSVLKDLLNQYVPKELTDRPKKGFTVPLDIWFRNELKEQIVSIPKNLPNFINKSYVDKLINEHLYRNRNHSYTLWNLMRLNSFYKKFNEE